MSQNREMLRQWSEELEAGKRNEPLLELATRLQMLAVRTTTPRPPAELKGNLRQQLLESYQPRWFVWLWRGASSAAALGVLAVVVAAALFVISNNTRPITGSQPAPTLAAEGSPALVFAPAQRLGARFGEAIEFVGYDLDQEVYLVGEEIGLTLYWQTIASPEEDIALALHLFDGDGQLVAQYDGHPLDETRPTSSWQPGEMISETVSLPLPPTDLAPGSYQLELGLYLSGTGERLVVTQPATQSTELLLGSIIVETSKTLLQPNGIDHLLVLSVTPESGQVFSSTTPITFEIRLDYELASLPEAIIKVAVVEQFGNGGGRGVANTQVTVQQGAGEVVLTAVLYPGREFNGSANLGLLVQMHHEERSAAIASEMPDTYHWRYEP